MAWWERFAKAEGDPGISSEGRQDLYDLELEEVSFVDAGDNPGARVLLYKRRGAGAPDEQVAAFARGQYADPEMVRELIDEVAGEAGTATRKESMTTQFTKTADVVAAVHKQAEERVANAAAGELSISQARVEVWLENPALAERYQQLRVQEAAEVADAMKHQPGGMMAAPAESVQKAQATVLQKHQAAVDELRKLYPHESVVELRNRAWREHPELYEEYRRAG